MRWGGCCPTTGTMDARTSASDLLQALADPDSGIQDIAAEALGRWWVREATEGLVQALPGSPEGPQVAICRALERLGDPAAVPALIAAAGTPDGEGDVDYYRSHREVAVRAAAVQALGALGSPDAVNPLVDAVHDPSDRMSLAAVRVLAPLSARRSLPPVLAARHDRCDRVAAATGALIALAPDLLERVLLDLFDGASPVDRGNAARGLARLGSEAACSRLIAALRDPDRDVWLAAAQALVHAGNPAAVVEPLIRTLDDPDLPVRGEAMLALAETGDLRAEPHLRDRGGDPDWLIRRATERWLRVRKERQSVEPPPAS